MNWLFIVYVIPLTFAGAIALGLALYVWQYRPSPTAAPFSLLMAAVALWCLAYALELTSSDLPTALFWLKVEYLGFVSVPVLWLIFVLHYAGKDRQLTRPALAFLWLEPVIVLGLAWSNDAHHLMWRNPWLDTGGGFAWLGFDFGPGIWAHVFYSYLLIFLGILLLFRVFARASSALYRRQAGLLLLGAFLPLVGDWLTNFDLSPLPKLYLTPFAFTLLGLIVAWSLFRFRFLDLAPVARSAVVESMADGVIVLDGQNRIVDVNPAAQAIMNRPAGELIGRQAEEALSQRPDLVEKYAGVTEANTEIAVGQGEARRYFDLHISPLYDRRGRLSGRLIVLRDVTERNQTAEALALARDQALEASHLKSELLANVSHDLRTPLSIILGYTEMLQDGFYGPLSDKHHQVISEVVDSTRQLINLVNNLLDQVQIETDSMALNITSFSPADLVDYVHVWFDSQAESHRVKLTSTIEPGLPAALSGDLARLQQMLLNLVSNGLKFTDPGGTVRVRLFRADDTYWAMQVTDTGCGIPAEAQARIFEAFWQADGSSTREYTGIGLGLAIVKHLAMLMGGRVTFESTTGQGSTFTVLLPLSLQSI